MTELGNTESNKNRRYQRYRPEMYSEEVPIFWWVRKGSYIYFIARELTSLFVAAYAVLLIVQLISLKGGAEAYEALLTWFETPLSIGLHAVIFVFVVFHSISWFRLAPTAMVLRIGKKRIPDGAIVAVNFIMWGVLSAGIAWLILTV